MRTFQLYKHKNNTEVAMMPIKSFYVAQGDYFKLKVRWFNIVNPQNIYDTGIIDNLKIKRESILKDWSLLT